jgi:hypothetical protein
MQLQVMKNAVQVQNSVDRPRGTARTVEKEKKSALNLE